MMVKTPMPTACAREAFSPDGELRPDGFGCGILGSTPRIFHAHSAGIDERDTPCQFLFITYHLILPTVVLQS
jgi:hypothetical protein